MSCVLIEGKRYYKDDITGRISLDTASNEEAERRAQRNRVCSSQVGNGSNYGRKQVILTIFIIALLSGNLALLYNHYHVSKAQNTISQYMDSKDNEKRSHENRELSSETMNSNEYIMPDSTSRYLELTDVENMDNDTIQMVIYEIYARHGHEFILQKNKEYFSGKSWYSPISGKTDKEIRAEFNDYERANVKFLKEQLRERKGA